MRFFFCFLITTFSFSAFAQPTQIIRGKAVDNESNFPIPGVKIEIFGTNDSIADFKVLTDLEGNFEIKNVGIGKYRLDAKSSLYEQNSTTITVNSGKENIVQISLIERYQEKEEVVVMARKKNEVINEMALISAQKFSVD